MAADGAGQWGGHQVPPWLGTVCWNDMAAAPPRLRGPRRLVFTVGGDLPLVEMHVVGLSHGRGSGCCAGPTRGVCPGRFRLHCGKTHFVQRLLPAGRCSLHLLPPAPLPPPIRRNPRQGWHCTTPRTSQSHKASTHAETLSDSDTDLARTQEPACLGLDPASAR